MGGGVRLGEVYCNMSGDADKIFSGSPREQPGEVGTDEGRYVPGVNLHTEFPKRQDCVVISRTRPSSAI
jgi:hypothetical protein